jgi:hypothetical protein
MVPNFRQAKQPRAKKGEGVTFFTAPAKNVGQIGPQTHILVSCRHKDNVVEFNAIDRKYAPKGFRAGRRFLVN